MRLDEAGRGALFRALIPMNPMGKALCCLHKETSLLSLYAMLYPSPECLSSWPVEPHSRVSTVVDDPSMPYPDFLAVLVCLVFDDSGDTVGVGEGLGLILAVDFVGPVRGSHGCVCVFEGESVEEEIKERTTKHKPDRQKT